MTPFDKRRQRGHAVFTSTNERKNLAMGDVNVPAPGTYDSHEYKTISKRALTGGAPNNILSLQKAEEKRLFDAMFPFLVQSRFPDPKENAEMSNLGPGTYAPDETSSLTTNMRQRSLERSPANQQMHDVSTNKIINLQPQAASCFGSQQDRFN